MLNFTVYGVPAPQGSMKAFMPKRGRRPIITADNKATRPWKSRVAYETRLNMGKRPPTEEAVLVELAFFMPSPKRAVRRKPHTKPDLDKLVRAVLDALTDGGAWKDDGQVVGIHATKEYAAGPCDPAAYGSAGAVLWVGPHGFGIPRVIINVELAGTP